jgi:hypothetical protein
MSRRLDLQGFVGRYNIAFMKISGRKQMLALNGLDATDFYATVDQSLRVNCKLARLMHRVSSKIRAYLFMNGRRSCMFVPATYT